MPEYIGPVAIPEVAASGVFPLAVDYGSVREIAPQVVTHRFGFAEQQASQRFYLGPGRKVFRVSLQGITQTERNTLMSFWEARKGCYQPFTLHVVEPDGNWDLTVRWADPQMALQWVRESLWSGTLDLVEEPFDTPTYAIGETLTRFPSGALATALLSQVQEIVPLVTITCGASTAYLSDRRVSVGGNLYQPRLLSWDGIQQSIDGAADTASFTLGNADRVFTALANQVDLYRARITFSVFHVGTTKLLNLWAGEVASWDGGASNDFRITADDGMPLRLSYPSRKISRQDGFVVDEQPVSVGGKKGISKITATSVINDTAYGKPLKDIYVSNAAAPLAVACEVICGRDESEFYAGLGIVGRGPLSGYSSGDTRFMHTLDGQPHHGPGALGLRRSYGGDPASGSEALTDNSPDAGSNWFALDSTSTVFPQAPQGPTGAAFIQIRRNDEKGVQPLRPQDKAMQAWVSLGLGCWTWSAPGFRTWQPACTNPVWVAINTMLRAKGLQSASVATQEAEFDTAAAVAAAAVCDTSVVKIIGAGNETQFRFVGVIAEEKPLRDWLSEILSSCLGYYTHAFGKLKIGLRVNSSTVEAFTVANILLDSLQLAAKAPQYNDLTVSFADEDYAYQANTVHLPDTDSVARVGPLKANVNAAGIASKSQAARVLTVRLRESVGGLNAAEQLAARRISFRTTVLALNTEPGMVCSMTHSDMPGGSGEFRVTSWRLNSDWSIDVAGETTTDSMYDLTIGPKPTDVQPAPVPDKIWYGVQIGTAPQAPEPPTNVALAILDYGDNFGAGGTWIKPNPGGGTIGYAREIRYFSDQAATLPTSGWIPLGTVYGLDSESKEDGPYPRDATDRWAKLRVAGVNSDSALSVWVESAAALISPATGFAQPTEPVLGDWSIGNPGPGDYAADSAGVQYVHLLPALITLPANADQMEFWLYKGAVRPADPGLWESVGARVTPGQAGTWQVQPPVNETWVVCATTSTATYRSVPTATTPLRTVAVQGVGLAPGVTTPSVSLQASPVLIGGKVLYRIKYDCVPPASDINYSSTRIYARWTNQTWVPLGGDDGQWKNVYGAATYPQYSENDYTIPAPDSVTQYRQFAFVTLNHGGQENWAAALIVNTSWAPDGGFDASVINPATLDPSLAKVGNKLAVADSGITNQKLGSAAVTDSKVGSGISGSKVINIPAASFSPGIEPLSIQSGVPGSFTGQRIIYNSNNGQVYKWNGLAYVAIQTSAEIKAQLQASGLTAAEFASSIEPVSIVSALPGAKTTSTVFNTTDGKLYRWNGLAYVRVMTGADIKAELSVDQLTAGQIAAGAISTQQLAATEILVGGGGNKCPRFRVNDAFGTMIGFIGDDQAGFVGAWFSRARFGGTFGSPAMDASTSALTLTNAALAINGGSFTLALNGTDGLRVTGSDGRYGQLKSGEFRSYPSGGGSEFGMLNNNRLSLGDATAKIDASANTYISMLRVGADLAGNDIRLIYTTYGAGLVCGRYGAYIDLSGGGGYCNIGEYRVGGATVIDASRNYRWPSIYNENLFLGGLTATKWVPCYDSSGFYQGKIPIIP